MERINGENCSFDKGNIIDEWQTGDEFFEITEDFLIRLRMDNAFDTDDYAKIKSFLLDKVHEWKTAGSVPVKYVVEIVFLIDQLAGGSRFFDEETAIKVEDACLEIEDIINTLT